MIASRRWSPWESGASARWRATATTSTATCFPGLGRRRIATITVDDIAGLIRTLAGEGRAPRTIAGALATLGSILRYALRRGYITDSPLRRLEAGERPRPAPRARRALGQDEIARLLAACAPRYRLLIVTALYTGMRISELLALTWADIDFAAGAIHVRAQLSRAHHGTPAQRVAPKTAAAVRDIPLVAQLTTLLREHHDRATFAGPADFVFATSNGTPLGHRNAESRALQRAAAAAGLEPVRFHGLRHTFASHLIVDLGLDFAQVSRILGHASVTTTLNIYTHLFDDARHATEIRTRMAASPFARLLEPDDRDGDNVVANRPPAELGAYPSRDGAPPGGLALDRNLTTREDALAALLQGAKTCRFAGTSMELAGLEPATSWVRFGAQSGRLAGTSSSHESRPMGADGGRSRPIPLGFRHSWRSVPE